MCGIGGVVRFDGKPVGTDEMDAMGRFIAHRGPDGSGAYAEGNVGLFHCRLSIIDLSPGGHQPRITNDGRYAVVFNGEIVNYIELRKELEDKGWHFQSASDTEVLLACYQEYGPSCVERFHGFFSFVIIDWNLQKVRMFRDRSGIKPLYFVRNNSTLSFASEVKALIGAGYLQPRIDPRGLQDYLVMQLYTPRMTLFQDCESIEPGHWVEVGLDGSGWTIHRYWEIPNEHSEVNHSYEDHVEQLRELIRDAVTMWSRSDTAIGAYLSGGLDSSLVCSLAAPAVRSDLQSGLITFSSLFSGTRAKDEREYSNLVARAIDSEHHAFEFDVKELAAQHDGLLYALDMPIAGFASPYRLLSKIARKEVKVVLTGHGGDEMACGYPKYVALTLASQITQSRMTGSDIGIGYALPYIEGFEEQTRQILSRAAFREPRDIYAASFDRSSFLWQALNPDIRAAAGNYNTLDTITRMAEGREGGILKRLLYLDQTLLLPGLLHVEDRMSMCERLESRPPLLDHSIVEFMARTPDRFLLKNGLKSLIRDCSRGVVPDAISNNKRKSGIVYPIAEIVGTVLHDRVEEDLGYLDRSGMFERPVREFLNQEHELGNARNLWALWSLGSWIKSFNPSFH